MNILVAEISLSIVIGVYLKPGRVWISSSGHVPGGGGGSGQFLGTFCLSEQVLQHKSSHDGPQETLGHFSTSVLTMVKILLVCIQKYA